MQRRYLLPACRRDLRHVYKTRVSEFGDGKASALGDYLPGRLAMDEGERVIFMVLPGDYSGCLLFFYENGKAARVELSAYATVSNRRTSSVTVVTMAL